MSCILSHFVSRSENKCLTAKVKLIKAQSNTPES